MELSGTMILEYLGYLGYVVGGIFAVAGFFDRQNRGRRKENDRVTNDLIDNLNRTVAQQKEMIDKMQADMVEHTKRRDLEIKQLGEEIAHLKGRNSVLEDLFKGRNPNMDKVFESAPAIFEIARDSNGITRENNAILKHLTESIDKLLVAITPMVEKTNEE